MGVLIAPLTACAPEPVPSAPGESSGTSTSTPKPGDKKEPEGDSWPEKNPDEVYEKHTEIPADFPAGFAIPAGAEVDDTGSRGAGTWFLVLRATDAAAAATLWDSVIGSSGFAVSDEFETAEKGHAATLSAATLTASAMTIPQSDGSVLLSYDITQLPG